MSALLKIDCPDCGHPTQTTLAWIADYGLICEGCYKTVPLNATELQRGLAAIAMSWAEVDDAVLTLKLPLAGSTGAGPQGLAQNQTV